MPTLHELWGQRPLSELAAHVGIPFRRLEEYAAGRRPFATSDRAALAGFFGIAPEALTQPATTPAAPTALAARRRGRQATALPPRERVRPPRPAGTPPPTTVVTSQGSGTVRVSGALQRAPYPEQRGETAERAAFWLLELLVPHQPLRGEPGYPPILVHCAVPRRLLAPFRWLEPGDRVVLVGTPVPRADHLYLAADELSTPRAERLRQLLDNLQAGDAAAPAALEKLLGTHWRDITSAPPGVGAQTTRPPWSPQPVALAGPQGRLQITLRGQLQADPLVELDETGDGNAELLLELAPPRARVQLPMVRYRIQTRLRALRNLQWLQRGDVVHVAGDIVRAEVGELLVEAVSVTSYSDDSGS